MQEGFSPALCPLFAICNPHLPLYHTYRRVKKPFTALCLCKRCGLNCKNFLVLFPCTAVVSGKSESGTGGESTATKIKDSTASVTEIKTKESKQREGEKKEGREGMAESGWQAENRIQSG